jgi:hypothetical protein
MQLNTDKKGLAAVFSEWKLAVLDLLSTGEEVCSREVYAWVNGQSNWGKQGNTISRASVINFLNLLSDKEHLIGFREETCKGGYRRVYNMIMSRRELVKAVLNRFIGKLREIDILENVSYPGLHSIGEE